MKQLIEDASVESLETMLKSARSQFASVLKTDRKTLDAAIDNNQITMNAEVLTDITRGDTMMGITEAMFYAFLEENQKAGSVRAVQAMQMTMFIMGFNYASYLHEQRELVGLVK